MTLFFNVKKQYIKQSPFKLNKILKILNKKSYKQILFHINFLQFKTKFFIWKILNSVVNNSNSLFFLNKEKLVINQIYITKAPKLKRIRFRAKGRINKIEKRLSHIFIKLSINSILINF